MKNWTVAKRIVMGFAAVILVVIALGSFAYLRLAAIKRETARIAADALPGLLAITEIQSLAQQNYAATLRFILAGNPEEEASELAGIQKNVAAINQLTNSYNARINGAKDRELFDNLVKARAEYVPAFKEVCQLSADKDAIGALHALRTKLNPASRKFLDTIEAEVVFNKAQAEAAAQAIDDSTRSAEKGISLGLAVSLAVAVVLSCVIIRTVNRALGSVSRSLSDGANQLSSAAAQVSASSQGLAEGASEQAASLEETSASLEEVSSMTRRNTENAQAAKDLANQTRAAAEIGATDMQAMSGAMSEIKAASDNISKILKTIDEIAFQTNILALNAAVEAARAGESGLGFAVVADEVRNLAQRSAQAARETAQSIEASIKKSDYGVQISGKVEQSLKEIVTKARQVDEQVAQIASASVEQSQGISQVSTAVSQMDKVTQSTAANAEESAAAAEELNAQASVLKEAVNELQMLVGGSVERTERQAALDVAEPTAAGKSRSAQKRSVAPRMASRHNARLPMPPTRPSEAASAASLPMGTDFQDF